MHAASNGRGKDIYWTPECQQSFEDAKTALPHATLLHHPRPNVKTSITVTASDTAIGAQLEQLRKGHWVPLVLFFWKLFPTEERLTLLTSYQAVKHFSHFVEAKSFILYMDHKPLTATLPSSAERFPKQFHYLSFIAKFTSDIQFIRGKHIVVADVLSRVNCTSMVPIIDN